MTAPSINSDSQLKQAPFKSSALANDMTINILDADVDDNRLNLKSSDGNNHPVIRQSPRKETTP